MEIIDTVPPGDISAAHMKTLLAFKTTPAGNARDPHWSKPVLEDLKRKVSQRIYEVDWLSKWRALKKTLPALRDIADETGMSVDEERFLKYFGSIYKNCKGFRSLLLVKAVQCATKKARIDCVNRHPSNKIIFFA